MTGYRRMSLQLTSLLDLLLIVFFAQYMEMKIVSRQESARTLEQRKIASEENDELRELMSDWQTQQKSADQRAFQERQQLGDALKELFQVPESTVKRIVQPRNRGEGGGLSPAEISDLKSRFQQLATSRGDQVIDHLLTFNEMRKQFDVWEFYLNENGELLMTTGPDRQRTRSKPIETPEQFVDTVLQLRRQLPPTKDRVLILCRYGDCRLINKLAMTRGLPAIAERLGQSGGPATHFDYAIFGYRPEMELDSPAAKPPQ